MNFGNRFIEQRAILEEGIENMTMVDIKTMLCGKSHGDPYVCIDCPSSCSFGKRAIELLEIQTKGNIVPMNKKQMYDASRKLESMENYLEAMKQSDPVVFIKEKYNLDSIRLAKNKVYQWQHNYGKNLGMIEERIKQIKLEISASDIQTNKESSAQEKTEIEEKTPMSPAEEKKHTRREEKEISKNHLERTRHELEEECLQLEAQIREHQKAIEKCENRINEISEEAQAIRRVLEIFNKGKR